MYPRKKKKKKRSSNNNNQNLTRSRRSINLKVCVSKHSWLLRLGAELRTENRLSKQNSQRCTHWIICGSSHTTRWESIIRFQPPLMFWTLFFCLSHGIYEKKNWLTCTIEQNTDYRSICWAQFNLQQFCICFSFFPLRSINWASLFVDYRLVFFLLYILEISSYSRSITEALHILSHLISRSCSQFANHSNWLRFSSNKTVRLSKRFLHWFSWNPNCWRLILIKNPSGCDIKSIITTQHSDIDKIHHYNYDLSCLLC